MADDFKRIPIDQIHVERDERQRREIDTSDLLESIEARGVLQPIIVQQVDDKIVLIAGERRLTASQQLSLPTIPCRFIETLSRTEAEIIELEENIKRADLTWQDQVNAINRIHNLYLGDDPTWTKTQTAEQLSLSANYISKVIRVAEAMAQPRIAAAPTLAAAYNMLARTDQRAVGDAMSSIMEAGSSIFDFRPDADGAGQEQDQSTAPDPAGDSVGLSAEPAVSPSPAPQPKPKPKPEAILNESFLEWAPEYEGPRFNFIHCDFPFGIGVFEGKQSGRQKHTVYDDSPDIYWALVRCLCDNLDRIMSHSAHLMFWFSMEYYTETLEYFRQHAPSLNFSRFPLVWLKSDNVGILPDPKRGPRRIYETALIASREDRHIIRAVSNGYPAPTDKTFHHSTKPEPMLRHFFQMFVDETSSVLDPTCGSGSAIRAAESLGAKHTIGLEIDPETCEGARSALRQFRALKAASKS